jgi:hypothetical protein
MSRWVSNRPYPQVLTAPGTPPLALPRISGRIYGRRNAADVTIGVIPQADGSLRVQFDAKNLGPQDQGLEDRFVQAYKRRMGH